MPGAACCDMTASNRDSISAADRLVADAGCVATSGCAGFGSGLTGFETIGEGGSMRETDSGVGGSSNDAMYRDRNVSSATGAATYIPSSETTSSSDAIASGADANDRRM